ncbi:hypothetical protein QYF36_014481 [Acer negundo]|nr:hypothetical protein QYF36_014481 [Acer negundo]
MAIVALSAAPTNIRWVLLISFLSSLMLQSSLADDPLHLLGWSCNKTSTDTVSSAYSFNIGRLFSRKLYNEGGNSIYYKTTDGEDPDKVYGLYLCRGDVSKQTCQNCINAATSYLVNTCEGTKSAITWYDECLVRYSNGSFSSTFESSPAVKMSNDDNFNATDHVEFQKAVNQSFTQLIANATSSTLKYATLTVNISSTVTLYTLGQCIPDLLEMDCSLCLDSAAQLLDYGRRGSRYIYPSCYARFELYQFWESPVAAQEPVSPVEAPTHAEDLGRRNRKKNRASIATGISVLAVTVVVLLIGSLIWYVRRRNKRHRAEEDSNSQEVRLIRMREDRIGNNYPYDTLQGQNQMESQELPLFSLDLTLQATRHFSDENKLGEGGFGPVYKEDPIYRPSMSSVVAMLVSDNIRLPQPTQPAFSVGRAVRQGQSSSDVKFFSNEATRSSGQSSSDISDFSNEAERPDRFSSDVKV